MGLEIPNETDELHFFLVIELFKVVALTSQDGGSARIIFLTFWSLSMSSPKEERLLVILVNFVTISSIVSFSYMKKFSYW